MMPQLPEDGRRNLHQSGAVGLGVPFDEPATVLADRPFHREPPQVIEMAPSQSDGLAAAFERLRFNSTNEPDASCNPQPPSAQLP